MGHLSCAQSNNKEDDMGYKEDRNILLKAGFTEAEKDRLYALRRNLTESGRCQELIEYRRLEFVRWLITTGKLTERFG
jgi:hypothetical protein